MNQFNYNNKTNNIKYPSTINISGFISGKNNCISIGKVKSGSINIFIKGDNNIIDIYDTNYTIKANIFVGGIYNANNTHLLIKNNFSCGSADFLLHNPLNRIEIGDDCMFSSKITLRCGELPHLIFDLDSGEYIDINGNITIGNHVWIGQNVYITKKCTIPSGCIVAANCVATRKFTKENTVIAGNPGTVVKENIYWSQGRSELDKNSKFYKSFVEYYTKSNMYE